MSKKGARHIYAINPEKIIKKWSGLYRQEKPFFYHLTHDNVSDYRYFSCPMDILIQIMEEKYGGKKGCLIQYKTMDYNYSKLYEIKNKMEKDRKFYKIVEEIKELHSLYSKIDSKKNDDSYEKKMSKFEKTLRAVQKGLNKEGRMEAYLAYLLTECDFKNRMIAVLYEAEPELFLKKMCEIFGNRPIKTDINFN